MTVLTESMEGSTFSPRSSPGASARSRHSSKRPPDQIRSPAAVRFVHRGARPRARSASSAPVSPAPFSTVRASVTTNPAAAFCWPRPSRKPNGGRDAGEASSAAKPSQPGIPDG